MTVRKSASSRLSREGIISAWKAEVIVPPRNAPATRSCISLELRGEFTLPTRGVRNFKLTLFSAEGDPKGAVGGVHIGKAGVSALIELSRDEYATLERLAVSGNLRYCLCDFYEPERGRSVMTSAIFSSERPADLQQRS